MNKWDKKYLDLARCIASWSKDPSTKIGAVAIGLKGQVLAQGYNGFPRGVIDSKERYANKEFKYRYVVHAELNCIYNASLNGVSLRDSTLYVYGLPVCNECAKGIIQAGITRVVGPKNGMDVPNKWKVHAIDTVAMFKESGVIYDFI